MLVNTALEARTPFCCKAYFLYVQLMLEVRVSLLTSDEVRTGMPLSVSRVLGRLCRAPPRLGEAALALLD